jgi:hypothetical protein
MRAERKWAGATAIALSPDQWTAPTTPNKYAKPSASATAAYHVDISEAGEGHFTARCRETGTEIVSINAEHDLCHALTLAGHADGRVQFWRGPTPSLSHPSIHRMGRYRIALGTKFPKRVKREVAPQISSEVVRGSLQNRETNSVGSEPLDAWREARP